MRTIAKKLFCLGFIELLLSLMVCSDAHATVYDADRFVKCPKCGHILREISWSSGNTFNSTLWSDGKLDAPMLPSVPSFVQCPACGEFFYPKDNHRELSRQQADKVEKEYTKALNFSQWVRAFLLIGDKKIAYWGIWHTYNDFLRSGDKASYDRLRNVFVLYASKFIDELDSTRDKDRLFKAELCREIGRFDRCVELLDCKQFPDNMKSFADKVKQAALRKDRALFKVFEPQKK